MHACVVKRHRDEGQGVHIDNKTVFVNIWLLKYRDQIKANLKDNVSACIITQHLSAYAKCTFL